MEAALTFPEWPEAVRARQFSFSGQTDGDGVLWSSGRSARLEPAWKTDCGCCIATASVLEDDAQWKQPRFTQKCQNKSVHYYSDWSAGLVPQPSMKPCSLIHSFISCHFSLAGFTKTKLWNQVWNSNSDSDVLVRFWKIIWTKITLKCFLKRWKSWMMYVTLIRPTFIRIEASLFSWCFCD